MNSDMAKGIEKALELKARNAALENVARLVMASYNATDRHIPDSDLDDEQPLTLDVRLTLGDIRSIRRVLTR